MATRRRAPLSPRRPVDTATERLGGIHRAVDEEARRRRLDVGEDGALAERERVASAPPAGRPLELGIVEPLAHPLAGDDGQ